MIKQKADSIITEYLQKIYGFAVKKSFYYDEAEDLASEIVEEVYRSLLSSDEIYNIEGYIWRISEHVYAKYVSQKKKHEGVSLDGLEIPDETEFYDDEAEEEFYLLRREIAFLSQKRREIVYAFYYENKTISTISQELGIPEGTIKWHLNKAKNDLKEGYTMKRTIGKLGLHPIETTSIGHNGTPGKKGGPEYYLKDKLNLNIVYSVYFTPKTKEEIAEELGMTPVFIEDKIDYLEANGFLVKTKGDAYTTYVNFSPETYSLENSEKALKMQMEAAKTLIREYVPKVREAVADITDIYIPSGNRELLEMVAIYYGIFAKCRVYNAKKDLSKYEIKTTDGGHYHASVHLKATRNDPDYVPTMPDISEYHVCGQMNRYSGKYPVSSFSFNTKYDTRKGGWANNLISDYEALYEVMTGMIEENSSTKDKFDRLRDRGYLKNGKIQTMVTKVDSREFFNKIPELDKNIKSQFAKFALETAMATAKEYPSQMQDLIVAVEAESFISNTVAVMVMDILYSNGTFRPLTEDEKVTSLLLVFSDTLPQ